MPHSLCLCEGLPPVKLSGRELGGNLYRIERRMRRKKPTFRVGLFSITPLLVGLLRGNPLRQDALGIVRQVFGLRQQVEG